MSRPTGARLCVLPRGRPSGSAHVVERVLTRREPEAGAEQHGEVWQHLCVAHEARRAESVCWPGPCLPLARQSGGLSLDLSSPQITTKP